MKFVLCSIVFLLALCGHGLGNVQRSNDVRSYYKKINAKKNTTNDVCDECKTVVGDLKNLLNDPTKLDKVKFIIKLICDYLGGQEAQQCKNMVDNLDMLIHQLQPFLDNPEQLCKEIHLCGQGKIPTISRVTLVLMKSFARNLKSVRSNDIMCDECMFIANELKELISQASIQQKMKEEIEQVCQMLRSLQQECDDLVEQYFNILIQGLQAILNDPKKICMEVRMCTGFNVEAMKLFKANSGNTVVLEPIISRQRLTELQKFAFLFPQIQTENGESAACLICDVGLSRLVDKLNQPEVMDRISVKMSKVLCNFLPNEFQTNCIDFTNVYMASLIRTVVNKWTPDQICVALDACKNTSIATIQSMTYDERSAATCEACRVFTEFLSYEFRQQSFQNEMVQVIKSDVCNMLPGDLANECSNTIDNYLPGAMNAISDYIMQPSFCNDVYLC